MRDSLTTSIDHENNQFPLPFPMIQWEEEETYDDDDLACLEQIRCGMHQVKINKPHSRENGKQKSKPCLHRSLACCDHLSLLDVDQLVSALEKEHALHKALPRLSLPL